MAEPFAVGISDGVAPDAGVAVRARVEELRRVGHTSLDPVDILGSLDASDVASTLLIAIALAVGPGPWLAPLGIGTDVRPLRFSSIFLAKMLGQESEQWCRDAVDGLDFAAPPAMRAAVGLLFLCAALLVERMLLVLLDDSETFVLSLSGSLFIAACFFELIRPKLQTREEYERSEGQYREFLEFAEAQLELTNPASSCHETDIVREFRLYFSKYRSGDERITDADIERMMRRLNRKERTPAGYYKGIRLKPNALKDVF